MDDNKGWRQFQKLSVDRRQLARRAKRVESRTTRHAHRFVIRRINNLKLVRREITIWLLLIGVIVAGLGIQLVWSQNGYMTKAPSRGGSYAEASLGPVDTLNPLYVTSSAEASAARLIFSSLYNYDRTASLHTDIATGMEVAEGGRVYVVNLRKDAKWHDGRQVTAKDIVYTVNLMKNPATRTPLRINWVDVTAKELSSYSVRFTLPAAYAAFPYALTFPILPEHILGSVIPGALRENVFSRAPVGSGPFRFELLQQVDGARKARAVHLTANYDYYGGDPKLDRFELQAYSSEDDILAAVKAGEVSGAADISAKASDEVNIAKYRRTPQPLSSGLFVMLNNSNPILNDVAVRRALRLGTDREALRKVIGHGVLPLDLPFLSAQVGDGKDLPAAPIFDKTSAMSQLDAAGWKLGVDGTRIKDGKKLEITITTTTNKEYASLARELEKQWKSIGVGVKVRTIDTQANNSSFVQDTLQSRNYDVLLYELSIGADPDVYAYWHSSQLGQAGYNFTNYVSKTADALLASARVRVESDLRAAKYRQFAKVWLDDVPAIALYQPVAEYISSKNAYTVEPGSAVVTGADRYANVLDWTVGSEHVYTTP